MPQSVFANLCVFSSAAVFLGAALSDVPGLFIDLTIFCGS